MQNPQRLIPGARAETSALFELLKDKPVGHAFSYKQLSAHIRMDAQHEGHAYLASAIRRLQNQYGNVWLTDPNVGVYRANDSQRIKAGLDLVRRGFRSMGRAQKRLTGIQYDKLTEAEKRDHNAVMLAAQTARVFTGKVGLDKLRKELPVDGQKMPDQRALLELFKA